MARTIAPRRSPLVVVCALAGCVSPATQVLVVLDTDAPTDQRLELRATVVREGSSARGATRSWVREATAPTLALPASFAVVPAEGGERGERVTLFVDATLHDGPGMALSFRRAASFAFRPGESWTLRMFIATSCLSPATGCMTPGDCTVARRCDEQGLTCGDEGRCVPREATLVPTDRDVVLVRASDVQVSRMRDVIVMDATAMDATAMDATLARDATTARCSGLTDCSGVCVDTRTDVSHCGACGNACTGGRVCVAGACVCRAGRSDCSGVCLATGAACSAGVGACMRAGTVECDGAATACNAVPAAPTMEVCNGADDNCDGTIDEDPACVLCLALPTVNVGSLTHTGGDRDFDGNGPDVSISVDWTLAGTQVSARACVTARETVADWTAATGCQSVLSVERSPTAIDAVLDPPFRRTYRDSNHGCESLAGGAGVSGLTCVGDTSGDDVCAGANTCANPDCVGCEVRFGCVRVRRRPM
jgi:hypothetical protein